MLYLVTDLPVSWKSLSSETVTFRLLSLSCIKPADKKWWQGWLLAGRPEGRVLPAASLLWIRNEGKRRGEIVPILPEMGDTTAVTPFASKRDRKKSHRDIWGCGCNSITVGDRYITDLPEKKDTGSTWNPQKSQITIGCTVGKPFLSSILQLACTTQRVKTEKGTACCR